MVAFACEATPIAPAAVKAAIRQNEFEVARVEERLLALNHSSFPVAIETPSPFTRIIPESQPSKFNVAEAIRIHQRRHLIPSIFVPSVTKKPHIPLNGAAFSSSGTFWQICRHYIAKNVGDHHDIPHLKPM